MLRDGIDQYHALLTDNHIFVKRTAGVGVLSRDMALANQIDPNTGMNAWLRTGQCYDMKGQRAKAAQAFKQAVAGAPDSDAGKEARKYLTSPYRRPANQ